MFKLKYGVPQGSVLGPVLFTIYTIPLSDVMRFHQVPFQLYADDNQLVHSFPAGHPTTGPQTVAMTEKCIADIKKWLHFNKLSLNAPKSDFLDITSSRRAGSVSQITVDGVGIPSSDSVRDLGVYFDNHMDMRAHIKSVCKAANFNLYKIGRIRKFLDRSSVERLVHALVISKLDMNNGLLYGLPDNVLAPFQRVQNSAARLICGIKKRDHITPVLKDLHWLPVRSRIIFKVLLLCFKAKCGSAPAYLSCCLQQQSRVRLTRSSCSELLIVPRTKSRYGDRSFSVAGPKLWNQLPPQIRSITDVDQFKSALKSWLFVM